MRISKARLKQIINEEVQNYKRHVYENEFAGLPFDDDGEEEHEQVAIEKKRMVDSIEELLIHINPQQVVQHLQSLAAQVKQGKISESINEVGIDDDLAAVENAIATLAQLKKNIDKGFANTVMGAMLELNKIQDYLRKEQGGQLEEGQPVMYPQEVQTVAQVVKGVVEGGGPYDLTAIGDALEQAGLKIQRGYRYIMVFVKHAKIMIAPTSAVELEGNETVVGNFAVGEMQE